MTAGESIQTREQMRPFAIRGAAGETVRGCLHLPPVQSAAEPGSASDRRASEKVPVLLLAHGFKGFADYGFLPLMADRLCAAGLAVLRFSFSHCGVTGAEGDRFDRPDLFEKDSFSRQITDVLKLIDAMILGKLPDDGRLDPERIAMAGHSRGGVTAVLATGKTDRLKALVTLASPERCNNDPAVREQVMRKGRAESPSGRTGQMLYVGREYVEDIEHAGDCYDLGRRMELYMRPFLAIHGRDDATVACAASEHLAASHAAAGNKVTELILLDDCNHTFNYRHGQRGGTPQLDRAIEAMTRFLTANL